MAPHSNPEQESIARKELQKIITEGQKVTHVAFQTIGRRPSKKPPEECLIEAIKLLAL